MSGFQDSKFSSLNTVESWICIFLYYWHLLVNNSIWRFLPWSALSCAKAFMGRSWTHCKKQSTCGEKKYMQTEMAVIRCEALCAEAGSEICTLANLLTSKSIGCGYCYMCHWQLFAKQHGERCLQEQHALLQSAWGWRAEALLHPVSSTFCRTAQTISPHKAPHQFLPSPWPFLTQRYSDLQDWSPLLHHIFTALRWMSPR